MTDARPVRRPIPQPGEAPRVALVTGASTGIGYATAMALKEAGWRTFATVRRADDVVRLSRAGRGLIEVLLMDVTDDASVQRAAESVRERAGRLDGLVNNAGIAVAGPLELISADQLRHQLEVNVVGLHRVTHAMLPLLRASRGRIVNISSLGGEQAFPFLGPYSASKFAVEGLSDALRLELSGVVKVIVLQPGSVQTPIWDKSTARAILPSEDDERYPVRELTRVLRFFQKVGERGVPPQRVAQEVLRALTMENPPSRWPVISRQEIPQLLFRLLPSVVTDRIKQRLLRWPPS